MDCLFCKIIEKEISSYTIYEDDITTVFLDINPESNGHCLLIPKKHFNNIVDVDFETLNYINKIIKQMYCLLKEKLNIDGLTIIQNNDYGQEIKHLHFHLIPRYTNDKIHFSKNNQTIKDLEIIYNKITN